jgi:hypothetical protein
MIPTAFAEVPSISNDQALLSAKFDFTRETLETKDSHKGPGLDGLLFTRPDGKFINKPIKADRMVLKYEDVVQFVINELDKTGVTWKFKNSVITKNGGLHAEVLFDYAVANPDDKDLSALAIIKSDLTSLPLQVKFGTYRYVCMNGVTVGDTISDVLIRPKLAHEMLDMSLQDQFSRAFAAFETVGLKYKSLLDAPLSLALRDFLTDVETPFTLKKMALKQLEKDSVIRMVPKTKLADIRDNPLDTYTLVADTGTKWTLYNALTSSATWLTDSLSARTRQYGMISAAMGV